ncbi:MAG TPA: DUF6230 family protein [Streptosporangiaceae bacterium]|nr:DUF6230 family protein [Streptosporangiaceae bacterium]
MSSSDNTSARSGRPGRVRWKRFALIAVPSLAATGALLGLTAGGALASSFSISGQQFEVSANSLSGTGFQQFGTVDQEASGKPVAVAESQIGSAKITNLCQSVVAPFPFGLGTFTLRITAGGGGTPVSASSLIIDANQLSGSTAIFHHINIGQDASTLNAVPGAPAGAAGTFGQQASDVTIDNLQQTAYSTSAGTFTLPGFSLNLAAGTHPCF